MKKPYLSIYAVIFCTLLTTQTARSQCGLSGTATAAAGADNSTLGTLSWSNPGNTAATDGSYATASAALGIFSNISSHYLTLSNFGFNIPAGYTICGVGVSITRNTGTGVSPNAYVTDNVVQLATINGAAAPTPLGSNQALTGFGNAWPSANGTATYGGNGNTMGATLTPASVNAAGFGMVISAQFITVVSLTLAANIDKVSMSIYTDPVIILPITLENFTVTGGAAGNRIQWTAAISDIASRFVVQRSADGASWQDISSFTTFPGIESYSYTDAAPLAGPNYYRLELLNVDGTSAGYSIIAIVAGKRMTPGVHIYPNPVHDQINITASATFSRLSLSDLAGRTLWVKEYPGGISNIQLPAGDLLPGIYLITLDGTTYKLIKN